MKQGQGQGQFPQSEGVVQGMEGELREGKGEQVSQGYEISIVSYKDENNLLRCCWKQQNLSEISQFLSSLNCHDGEQEVSIQKSPFIESFHENQTAESKPVNLLQYKTNERTDSLNHATSFKESLAKFQRNCTISENNTKYQNSNSVDSQNINTSNISDKNKNDNCVYLSENFYIGSGSGSAEISSNLFNNNNSSQLIGSGEGGDWQSGVGSLPPPSSASSSITQKTQNYAQIGRSQKTAFNEIFRKCCKGDDQVIVFHYTDAAPHVLLGNYGVQKSGTSSEKQQLSFKGMLEKNMLEGRRPGFDWVKICKYYRSAHVQVFTFLPASANSNIQYLNQFYLMLGTVVRLPSYDPAAVTQSTMSVFLKLSGQQLQWENYNFESKNINNNNTVENSNILQFSSKSISKLSKLKNEGNCFGWLTPNGNLRCSVNSKGHVNIVKGLKIDLFNLINNFQIKNNDSVIQSIELYFKKLFEQKNISSIIYNPIFLNLFLQIQKQKQKEDKNQKVLSDVDVFFEGYLQDDIRQIFLSQIQEWNQINKMHTKLKFECPFKPNSKCVYPDFKIQCTKCAKFRSFTLMQDGVCGLCRNFETDNCLESQKEKEVEAAVVVPKEPSDVGLNSSHLRECVDCHGIYATVKEVNCVSKCHFCSGQTLGVKAQRFRGHNSPHRNVKEKKKFRAKIF
eukprot:TRINITY_DN28760_c0_g3_i3.p1 TRINITY_DN28760_c0_g3~~TRINITY_DN28760_c0_g3_i3.p1  ORF type:complete len:689 (-),score=102.76 TRINITY_DN28760_c0_g3_i3:1118-3154(-)